MMLYPPTAMMMRTYVQKIGMRLFLPVLRRIFSYHDTYDQVSALAIFQNFCFCSWPKTNDLFEILRYLPDVTEAMIHVIERWDFVEKLRVMLPLVTQLIADFKQMRELRVHKTTKKWLRQSLFGQGSTDNITHETCFSV